MLTRTLVCKRRNCNKMIGKTKNDRANPVVTCKWSGQRDSNPRPSPWQGDALPAEPCPHINLSNASLLEATPGFEPGVKALQASALPLGHVAILASSCLDKNWPVSRPVLDRQWSGQRDSNPRPSPWQGDALPAEPCPQMVGVTRFELVTSSVSGKRSPPELNAHLLCFLEPFGSIGKTLLYQNQIRCQELFLKSFRHRLCDFQAIKKRPESRFRFPGVGGGI